jgi:hypothetical protein
MQSADCSCCNQFYPLGAALGQQSTEPYLHICTNTLIVLWSEWKVLSANFKRWSFSEVAPKIHREFIAAC